MKIIAILLILVLVPFISALTITEVELNPPDSDSGNEWIEFYSEEEINLSSYRILNNDGDEIFLSGNMSGYYIYFFQSQWLDNSDERIFLYKGNELIQQTDLFEDSLNNNKTFQLCGKEWEFKESSPGKKNSCQDVSETTPEEENSSSSENSKEDFPEEKETRPKEIIQEINKENVSIEPIYLTPQNIKTPENFSSQEKSNKSIYFLIGFCALLGILYFFQNKNRNKNEFR